METGFIDKNKLRLNALRGYISDVDCELWRSKPSKLLIFVSSTFTDTGIERNLLISHVLPQLRSAGQRVGVEVTFVDMRWGVRDENTLDHRTWIECSRELERCRRESCGLFFLSLQSEKYGYVSLPRSIPQSALDRHLEKCTGSVIDLVREWYRLDTNAVPTEYVLKSLSQLDDESFWQEALPILSVAFDGLPISDNPDDFLNPNSGLLIGRSVTEWETKAALSIESDSDRVFWMKRTFVDGVDGSLDDFQNFDDTLHNSSKLTKLQGLKKWMEIKIPSERILDYEIGFNSLIARDEPWTEHLKKWEQDICSILNKSLQDVTLQRTQWDKDGCGMGINGVVLNEMLHHVQWAQGKASTFHGREDLIQRALVAISNHNVSKVIGTLATLRFMKGKSTLASSPSASSPRPRQLKRLNAHFGLENTEFGDGLCVNSARSDESQESKEITAVQSDEITEGEEFFETLEALDSPQQSDRDSEAEPDEGRPETTSSLPLKTKKFTRKGSKSLEQLNLSAVDIGKHIISRSDSILSNLQEFSDAEIDSDCETNIENCALSKQSLSEPGFAQSIPTEKESKWARLRQCLRASRHHSNSSISENEKSSTEIVPRATSASTLSPKISSGKSSKLGKIVDVLRRSPRSRQKFSDQHVSSSKKLSSFSKSTDSENFKGICLAIVGLSGTGKTALMAKLACEINKTQLLSDRVVIIRFCGTSPGSTSGLSLVHSICHQIRKCQGLLFDESISKLQYSDSVACLHKLLHDYPVVLLIDSLDQLSNTDLARSDISFLKGVVPHRDTRIIVSTLPDERDETTGGWKYYYGCDSKLQASGVPRIVVEPFKYFAANLLNCPSTQFEGVNILQNMLSSRGRTLTPIQWSYVIQQTSVEPTALYLWLAVRVVEKWSSNDETNVLAPGVRNLIMQIFDDVERCYGRELTQSAFGFISCSVHGVSDAEMEDLLSLDPHVMMSVNQYCQDAHRLPSHVWLRLRAVVHGLITEREGGCLGWYHRQLRETAQNRLSPEEKSRLHTIMANYYGGIVPESEILRTGVSRQLLLQNSGTELSIWLPSARINKRRCEEAAHHMIICGMYPEAIQELCSIESVLARAKCGEGFNLITQLSQILKSPHSYSVVDHYYRWIRREIHSIIKNPSLSITISCGRQPLSSIARRDLLNCLAKYECSSFHVNSWVRCRALGGEHDFDPLQSVLQAHTDTISSVCFSSDGIKIASSSWDKTVRIWDASIGNILCTLEGHFDAVTCVRFNKDCSQIVTASEDRTIRLWDAIVGSPIRTLLGHSNSVNTAVFSGNSMIVASGSNDCTVKLWNVFDGEVIFTLAGHTNNVSSVDISIDERTLASGSHDTSVRLWNIGTGCPEHVLNGHQDRVNSVCFNSDGKVLVSGSDDETVRTWEVKLGLPLNVFEGQHDPVPSVCISLDGTMIVSGSWDSTIRVWDPTTGSLFCSLDGHTGTVNSVCVAADGETIVSGSEDKTVRIWDANVWYSDRSIVEGHSGYVTCVCISSNSIVASGSEDKTIKIWNIDTGLVKFTLEGHSGDIASVCISQDGSLVASGSSDDTVRVWNGLTGSQILSFKNRYVTAVCFDHSAKVIASGSWGYAIRIWNISTGTSMLMKTLKGHTGDVSSVCFNASGTKLLSGSFDNTAIIWDVSSTKALMILTGHEMRINSVSWCLDETLIVTGSEDKSVRLWDSHSGAMLHVLLGHTDIVSSVCISQNGKVIVSGSWDSTVRVWRTQSGQLMHVLDGHSNRVNSVCFSTNGGRIVSSSDDKSILIWDASTGMPIVK